MVIYSSSCGTRARFEESGAVGSGKVGEGISLATNRSHAFCPWHGSLWSSTAVAASLAWRHDVKLVPPVGQRGYAYIYHMR